ncbi:MAG: amidohydrolase family protein [Pseudomonadota bacterium]
MRTGAGAVLLLIAMAANAEPVAIVGGTIHTMSSQGTVQQGTVIIDEGEIVAVKSGRQVPPGAKVIEADGYVITPGLFAAHTALGVVEVSAERSTVDAMQQSSRYRASFDISDAYNPDSSLIPVNRVEGVTRAVIVPYPGPIDGPDAVGRVFSGAAAVVHLGDEDDFLVMRKSALVAHIGEQGAGVAGGSRAAALLYLQTALDDAIEYGQFKDAYDTGARRRYSLSKSDLDALQSVVAGETPVYLTANRASDIRVAIDLADRYGLRLVIVGGAEAWKVADRLAADNIAVLLSPLDNLPATFDRLGATLQNARRLHEAGVQIIISDTSSHNARNLTQLAGNAVANGLPWIEGLRAITTTPARVLGLGDRFGSLAPGMVADIVVWDGDPLELDSYPTKVFIDGIEVSLETRQTLLRDRYRDLTPTRAPAYRH